MPQRTAVSRTQLLVATRGRPNAYDVKRALRFLLATEEMGATWFSVLQRIDTLSGDAPCGFPKITRVRGLNHP